MNSFPKYLRLLPFKTDCYLTLFLGTLAVYFTAVVGDYTREKVMYLIADVAVTTVVVSIICTKMAWKMLSAIASEMENPKQASSKTKERILQFPLYFGIISGMKVPGVFIPVIIALMAQVDLTLINLMPLLLLIPMNIPIVFDIAYLYTENSLGVLLKNENIRDAKADQKAYKKLLLNRRIFLFAVSVLLIPVTVFGYFIVLLNLKLIVFNNIAFHLLFIIALSVLAIVVLLRFMAKNIKDSMTILVSSLENITNGDFGIEGAPMLTSNEIGVVCQNVNTLLCKLRDVIIKVKESSEIVTTSSHNITGAAQNLSGTACEQSSSMEEITTSIEEISSTISQNADNSRKVSRLAEESAAMADEGGKVTVEAVNAINEVDKSSRKISEIISVINEISFQTNLLALNAAIEAARAGSQGKGFAVVAGEVRHLAQRSGNAAKEINNLINDSIDVVKKATALSNRSGDALKDIVKSIKNVTKLISDIAAASEEQKNGIDQVKSGMEQVNSASQQTASSSEELASTADVLAENARGLHELMAYFRIKENAGK